jgi:hypothetical protein
MSVTDVAEDLVVAAPAGYLATKSMAPLSMRLYELESEGDRRREGAVRTGPPYEIAAKKVYASLGMELRAVPPGQAQRSPPELRTVGWPIGQGVASCTQVRVYSRGMNENLIVQDDWVPAACTLPTVEQPLRRADFDDLFAQDVLRVHQTSPQQIRFELRAAPDVAARAASLAVKETDCCSFFTFDLTITDGKVAMIVSTAPSHEPVLAAMAARAHAQVGANQ